MNYSKIKKYDISNGCGIRASIFFTGCPFHCPGCFNPELWDKNAGKAFDDMAKSELFTYLSDEHCDGLSVLGGEPLVQGIALVELLEEVREKFPTKNIWLWTGFEIDGNLDETQKMILNNCDYVIDGQFKEKLSGIKLRFRGSSNQRIWKKVDNNFVRADEIENNSRFK